MLIFEGREENCSSSGAAPSAVGKNLTVDADVDAIMKGNSHSLSKKRGPADDVCVTTGEITYYVCIFVLLTVFFSKLP